MSEFQRIAAKLLRRFKFAIAALLAGARAIPLGDNGRITRELGEYGAHLRGCCYLSWKGGRGTGGHEGLRPLTAPLRTIRSNSRATQSLHSV
jgi:hypothetical protein